MRISSKMLHDEQGSVSVVFLLALTLVLLPLIGLTVDAARLFVIKAKLASAVDAAALAAGRSLSVGATVAAQTSSAKATGAAYFKANYPDNYWKTTPTTQIDVAENQYKVRTVTVQGQAVVPLLFMQMLGFESTTVKASGQASRRDVNVMLVLDRSGSMADSKSCEPMKAAAQFFTGKFSNGRDRLGLITFARSANVDFAPSVNFNTQTPTLNSVIGTIVCANNTSTAEAISEAYDQIKLINQPGSFNVIVLFTDGQPNGVTASYPVTAASKCQNRGPLLGSVSVDSTVVSGIWNSLQTVGPSKAPGLISAPGCAFPSATKNAVTSDLDYIPDIDYFNNPTTGLKTTKKSTAGTSAGHLLINTTANMNAASWNAADNAATTVRKDTTYQPVIYTLGYSSDADKVLMQRMSNDPSSAIYNPAQPSGKFVYAPDQGALIAAFNAIASEILRLSQ